jgi:hypothetical protein
LALILCFGRDLRCGDLLRIGDVPEPVSLNAQRNRRKKRTPRDRLSLTGNLANARLNGARSHSPSERRAAWPASCRASPPRRTFVRQAIRGISSQNIASPTVKRPEQFCSGHWMFGVRPVWTLRFPLGLASSVRPGACARGLPAETRLSTLDLCHWRTQAHPKGDTRLSRPDVAPLVKAMSLPCATRLVAKQPGVAAAANGTGAECLGCLSFAPFFGHAKKGLGRVTESDQYHLPLIRARNKPQRQQVRRLHPRKINNTNADSLPKRTPALEESAIPDRRRSKSPAPIAPETHSGQSA